MFALNVTNACQTARVGLFSDYPAALKAMGEYPKGNSTFSILEVEDKAIPTDVESLGKWATYKACQREIGAEGLGYDAWYRRYADTLAGVVRKPRPRIVPEGERCVVRPVAGVPVGHAQDSPPADASPMARDAYLRHRSTMNAANLTASPWGKWFAHWQEVQSRGSAIAG